MSSCGTKDYNNGNNDDNNSTPQDTISVDTFDTWVSNWKNDGLSVMTGALTEYFTMAKVDLQQLLDQPGSGRDSTVAARFVLGLQFTNGDSIPHLMLVGVNNQGDNLTDAKLGQYIYDVTKPCPSMCGVASLPD